jgi:hypothetical protein
MTLKFRVGERAIWATCSDVAEAFYRTIEKLGFKKESRCGYAVGIDWAEPTRV